MLRELYPNGLKARLCWVVEFTAELIILLNECFGMPVGQSIAIG